MQGGGSAADSTFMLREAISQGISSYLQTIYDPKAALACEKAGVGSTVCHRARMLSCSCYYAACLLTRISQVKLSLGGHTDDLHGAPIEVSAVVRALSDGRYTNPPDMPTHGGSKFFNAGLSARVELQPGGQTVLVTSARDGNTSRATMPA
jgi:microcystin degradation protein MlrC